MVYRADGGPSASTGQVWPPKNLKGIAKPAVSLVTGKGNTGQASPVRNSPLAHHGHARRWGGKGHRAGEAARLLRNGTCYGLCSDWMNRVALQGWCGMSVKCRLGDAENPLMQPLSMLLSKVSSRAAHGRVFEFRAAVQALNWFLRLRGFGSSTTDIPYDDVQSGQLRRGLASLLEAAKSAIDTSDGRLAESAGVDVLVQKGAEHDAMCAQLVDALARVTAEAYRLDYPDALAKSRDLLGHDTFDAAWDGHMRSDSMESERYWRCRYAHRKGKSQMAKAAEWAEVRKAAEAVGDAAFVDASVAIAESEGISLADAMVKVCQRVPEIAESYLEAVAP